MDERMDGENKRGGEMKCRRARDGEKRGENVRSAAASHLPLPTFIRSLALFPPFAQ